MEGKPPKHHPNQREYFVYLRIDVRMEGAEPVTIKGPNYGFDARDALANAIGQVYGSFDVYCADKRPVNSIKDPRPLIFPVAVTEVVPTAEELLATTKVETPAPTPIKRFRV